MEKLPKVVRLDEYKEKIRQEQKEAIESLIKQYNTSRQSDTFTVVWLPKRESTALEFTIDPLPINYTSTFNSLNTYLQSVLNNSIRYRYEIKYLEYDPYTNTPPKIIILYKKTAAA